MDLVKCRIQSLVPLDMRINMDKSWLFWVSSWSWWFLEFVVTNQFERLPSLDVERGRTTCFDPIYLRRSSWTMIQSNSPQKSLRPWVAFTWRFDSHMRDSLQQALNSHHFWKNLVIKPRDCGDKAWDDVGFPTMYPSNSWWTYLERVTKWWCWWPCQKSSRVEHNKHIYIYIMYFLLTSR